MYRLGLRLTLRSGREPFVRLLVTAAAVAVGVAIMLAVLADFNAFKTTNNRPSWESTQGQTLTASYASATNAELWNYSNDIYQGQTIERLDVAALGPGAPVPPGITAAARQRAVLRVPGHWPRCCAPSRPMNSGTGSPAGWPARSGSGP